MPTTDDIAAAVRAATIDANDRTVVIGGVKFAPSQARTLAAAIEGLATAAEAAVDHAVGDVFIAPRAGAVFVSDGVFLWHATVNPAKFTAVEASAQFGRLTQCVGIGAAVRAGR